MPQVNTDHQWVVAATIPLPEPSARHAQRRGTVRLDQGLKVDVLETYCDACRRPFTDVAGRPCSAAASKDHLIGGPTGERKKRKGEPDPEASGVEFAVV